MRLHDGRYECTLCGAVLDVDSETEPKVAIHAASGKPNERVLSIDGNEIHRCVRPDSQVGTSSSL